MSNVISANVTTDSDWVADFESIYTEVVTNSESVLDHSNKWEDFASDWDDFPSHDSMRSNYRFCN